MNNKKKVFMLTGIFICLGVLCLSLFLILTLGKNNIANASDGNNQSYKQELPKNSEEVYSGKFAINSEDDKVVAAYIEHCMGVVASDGSSKKANNLNSLSSNRIDEFLYYKITDEQNSKYALRIARTDKGGYTQFSSDTVPWYDQRYSFYSVVVEDEIYPKSTAA